MEVFISVGSAQVVESSQPQQLQQLQQVMVVYLETKEIVVVQIQECSTEEQQLLPPETHHLEDFNDILDYMDRDDRDRY